MKNTQSHPPVLIGNGRCDYLGLKDDPQTCLDFPSAWNYCHHVRPPDSVRLEYQRQYCQSPDHVQCQVLQNEKMGPLPSGVRGRHNQKKRGGLNRLVKTLALLLVLALTVLILWLAQSPSLLVEIRSSLFGTTSVNDVSIETLPAFSFVTGTPFAGNPPIVSAPIPGIVSTSTFFFIPPGYSLSTLASQTFSPSPVSQCGHSLDVTFGVAPIFLIHRAKNGESLNMYEDTYHTSVNAILAVNYQLSIPLRKDKVLVIPVGQTNAGDLPAFETYLASETNSSVEALARQLSTDPTALKRYNGLDESCRAFSGWLLIPKQTSCPEFPYAIDSLCLHRK